MPLTKTGREVLRSMQNQYGKERGKSVFHAKMNKENGYTEKWHEGKKKHKKKRGKK